MTANLTKSYDIHVYNSSQLNEFTLFLKLCNHVRKVKFSKNGNLESLRELFLSKYRSLPKNEFSFVKETLPPLWIENPISHIKHELEDTSDLYEHAIIEVNQDNTSFINSKQFYGSHILSPTNGLAIVMVGLPGSGKSYISHKISRYLHWIGISCRVFNVNKYRHERIGAHVSHHFFDSNNEEFIQKRIKLTLNALDDMIEWLKTKGIVAIYDDTNVTRSCRKMIMSRCSQENFEVVFLESILKDTNIIEQNIRAIKNSPDYVNIELDTAIDDYKRRILHFQEIYETLDEFDQSYIKVIDMCKKININNIRSYIPNRVLGFLINLHSSTRSIFLTRHGESEYNRDKRIGGDSPLTKLGDKYAHTFAEWILNNFSNDRERITIFSSTMLRAIQTTNHIVLKKYRSKLLDEIDAGDFDGLTYDQISQRYPSEYAARANDKLRYRYPRGESYLDLVQRLEPIIFELERQKQDVIVVSHQAVLRCIYSYFNYIPIENCYEVKIPLHRMYEKMIFMPLNNNA